MTQQFFSVLRGKNEVPPVKTRATGFLGLASNPFQTKLYYSLRINNIQKATVAHLHLGTAGENGPVVAFLFGPVKPGISLTQGLVTGTLTRYELTGPLKGQTIRDLIRLMEEEKIYVNVHTQQKPDGEIRGQVLPHLK
jgi:hypothetical protein